MIKIKDEVTITISYDLTKTLMRMLMNEMVRCNISNYMDSSEENELYTSLAEIFGGRDYISVGNLIFDEKKGFSDRSISDQNKLIWDNLEDKDRASIKSFTNQFQSIK